MYIIVKETPAGGLIGSHFPMVHKDRESAYLEAHRLAASVPGCNFVIFQAISGVKKEIVYNSVFTDYTKE